MPLFACRAVRRVPVVAGTHAYVRVTAACAYSGAARWGMPRQLHAHAPAAASAAHDREGDGRAGASTNLEAVQIAFTRQAGGFEREWGAKLGSRIWGQKMG